MLGAFALISSAVSAQALLKPNSSGDSRETAVITLDYQGSRLKRINDAPTLSIYADGRVEMPRNYAHMRAYQGQISPAEVQALVEFAIRDQQFLSFDETVVKAKISAHPGTAQPLPEHLATTIVRIHTNDVDKTVSYFGLGHGPRVTETEQLTAIRSRLDRLMAVIKLGGTDQAKHWLTLANAEIDKQSAYPHPLTLDDLQSAVIHPDGSAYVRFAKLDHRAETSVSATISVDTSGASHIALAHDDLLPRQRN